MENSTDFPHGTYIPTGWRIIGRDAEQIARRVAAAAEERLDPGDASKTLYAVQCTAEPVVSVSACTSHRACRTNRVS